MTRNPVTEPQTEAGVASAENGVVILDGPGAVAATMSADAAARTGENLIAAAALAASQAEGRDAR